MITGSDHRVDSSSPQVGLEHLALDAREPIGSSEACRCDGQAAWQQRSLTKAGTMSRAVPVELHVSFCSFNGPAREEHRFCTGAWLASRFVMERRTHSERQSAADPAADNIRAIIEVERQAVRRASLGERVGQAISGFVGSMLFVVVHAGIIAGWIVWNSVGPAELRLDPYPFGLLTFIVSLEGVLIATFVLIAQNRMSRQSDERNHLNLQISLLAEQELTVMLKLLRRICERFGIAPESEEDARAQKLTEETNVYDLVRTLRRELPQITQEPDPRSQK